MDRIDLFFDTPPVTAIDLTLPAPKEGTEEAAKRVADARAHQTERYETSPDLTRRMVNADAGAKDLENFATPDEAGAALLAEAAIQLQLSARGYHRVLKVARTIADLEGATAIKRLHIAEALSYRRRTPGTGDKLKVDALVH